MPSHMIFVAVRARCRGVLAVVAAAGIAATSTGCATLAPSVPAGYTGPKVVIADSGVKHDRSRGSVFAVSTINGQRTYNSVMHTRNRRDSATLKLEIIARSVPVAPMRLGILGISENAAPIGAIVDELSGKFRRVEGEVDFNPVEGRSYRVTGNLAPALSCVWVEEASTQEIVTEKVCVEEADD